MKIYFAGSIRGGRDNQEMYYQIITLLKNYGTVLSEHVGHESMSDHGEVGLSDEHIFERDVEWLKDADAVVADVSIPSIGVGYEIGSAEALGKKILCLYREGSTHKISGMISGNKNLIVKNYKTLEDIADILNDFLG